MTTIIYVLINIKIDKTSLYSSDDKIFKLKVISLKEGNNNLIITFSGRENLICYYEDVFPYEIGDYLLIEGDLEIPKNNTIPNLFNYKEYLYRQNIFYIIDIKNITLLKKNNNVLYKIKNKIINKINNYESNEYLNAFILGNTSYIDDVISDSYLKIGVNHLFAISGMHVSLLISIITFTFNKFKVNKYIVFSIISLFLIYYIFLVNFQVSIIRSVLCYIFMSLNKFLKLNIKNEYLVILAMILSLLFNPFCIYNLGFQYSYLISFVLIKYHNLIKGNYFQKMLIVSSVAFISSLPITIYHNFQVNLLSVLFNLIYVPLISIIIFPLCILCLCFPFLDNLLGKIVFYLEKMTFFFSNFELLMIMRKPNIWIIIVYLIIIFYLFNGLLKNKYKRIILLIIVIIVHYNINWIYKNSYLTFLDVAQGDSIFLHYNNENILIDTGGSIYSDYCEKTITYLKSMGIRKINSMVISHGDYDHMGEAIDLVNNFKVDKVIFNCGEFNELEQDLIKVLDKKKIPYYSCIKELNIDDNKLYFLNNKDYGNENDNSSVIYTELNNHRFLFMGDAGVEVEEDLIEKYNLQDIDVLKVGHHGSKTSSSKEFVNELNPKYSVISVGKNNRYGHPNKEVLEILEDSKVYRTDQDGSIIFKIKNNKLKIETCTP